MTPPKNDLDLPTGENGKAGLGPPFSFWPRGKLRSPSQRTSFDDTPWPVPVQACFGRVRQRTLHAYASVLALRNLAPWRSVRLCLSSPNSSRCRLALGRASSFSALGHLPSSTSTLGLREPAPDCDQSLLRGIVPRPTRCHRMSELTRPGARPVLPLRAPAAGFVWLSWPPLKGRQPSCGRSPGCCQGQEGAGVSLKMPSVAWWTPSPRFDES
jgi:hypothetical protein